MQITLILIWYFFADSFGVLGWALFSLAVSYYCLHRLYELYISVMALRDRRDAGELGKLDQVLGRVTLMRGLIVDVIVNLLASLPFLEPPQWHKGELLLTPRLLRLAQLPAGITGLKSYRRRLARWMLGEIDQHDKSGGHDVPESGK